MSHLASPAGRWPVLGVVARAPHAIGAAVPLVAIWTVAVLFLGLRRRRSSRRLLLGPGLAACAGAVPAMALWVLDRIAEAAAFAGSNRGLNAWDGFVNALTGGYGFWMDLIQRPSGIGMAVAGAWSWLLLSGRWRSQPTWIDRLGRALGFYWLSMILWNNLLNWLMSSYYVTLA